MFNYKLLQKILKICITIVTPLMKVKSRVQGTRYIDAKNKKIEAGNLKQVI